MTKINDISTLKVLRNKSNLTQKQVAKLVGITQAAYSQFEIGQTKPSPVVLKKLEAVFGQSIETTFDTKKKTNKKRQMLNDYVFFEVADARIVQRAVHWYLTELTDKIEKRSVHLSKSPIPHPTIFGMVFEAERDEVTRLNKQIKKKLSPWDIQDEDI